MSEDSGIESGVQRMNLREEENKTVTSEQRRGGSNLGVSPYRQHDLASVNRSDDEATSKGPDEEANERLSSVMKSDQEKCQGEATGGSLKTPRHHLKMTLRMKRSPVLDEVLAKGHSLLPFPDKIEGRKKKRKKEYEVLRLEGLSPMSRLPVPSDSSEDEVVPFQKGKRRSSNLAVSHRPMKRLKLLMGKETLSSIQLSPG